MTKECCVRRGLRQSRRVSEASKGVAVEILQGVEEHAGCAGFGPPADGEPAARRRRSLEDVEGCRCRDRAPRSKRRRAHCLRGICSPSRRRADGATTRRSTCPRVRTPARVFTPIRRRARGWGRLREAGRLRGMYPPSDDELGGRGRGRSVGACGGCIPQQTPSSGRMVSRRS